MMQSLWLLFAVLLDYLSSCLGQETVKGILRSLSQAATCYYQSNHSKVEAILLSALLKDAISDLADLLSHYSFLILNVKQGSCEY